MGWILVEHSNPKRADALIAAFERGRKDAKWRNKTTADVPYSDRWKAENWERGFHHEREISRKAAVEPR